jgi:hypothetical protein
MADVTFFGIGAPNGFATPDAQVTNQTASVAEVVLGGVGADGFALNDQQLTNQTAGAAEVQIGALGATGFGAPSVEIVPNKVSQAEVTYEASPSGAGLGKLSTEVTFYSPSLLASSVEAASVEFFSGGPPKPASITPNVNEVIFLAGRQAGYELVQIGVFLGGWQGQYTQKEYVPIIQPGLENMAGASGLIGKTILFIPSFDGTSAIIGFTATIQSCTSSATLSQMLISPTLPSPSFAAYPPPASGLAYQEEFALRAWRFVIPDIDRILRRSPVYEIILE